MDTKVYYVGDRPGGSWTFIVRNDRGGPFDLGGLTSTRMIMVDSDNNVIEFNRENTAIVDAPTGRVVFLWPNESVFTKPGRYQMQLELSNTSTTRRTSITDILVREMGGLTN